MIGPEALNPLAREILRHTLTGRPDLAGALLDVVAEYGDSADLYGVCCAAAETGRSALQVLYPRGGMGAGEYWALPDHAGDVLDRHRLFARRFLAAHLNDDPVMSSALFQAADVGSFEDRRESACALLACVHDLVRRAEFGPVTQPGGTPS